MSHFPRELFKINTSLLWFYSLFLVFVNIQGQNPKVNISQTDPGTVSTRKVVRGIITRDVTLTCSVENKLEIHEVRWQLTRYTPNGVSHLRISTNEAVDDNIKYSIEKPRPTSWRLRVKALQTQDEGVYTCFIQLNINTRAQSNRTVLSTAPPEIVDRLTDSDKSTEEGEQVTLKCNATGIPQPTVLWRRQGNAVLPDGGVIRMGGTLNIGQVKYTDQGVYICEAMNDIGKATRKILLKITYSPKVKPDEPRVGQAVGYRKTLVCHVDAKPQPRFQLREDDQPEMLWRRDGQAIISNDKYTTRVIEGAYGRLTFELIITSVKDEDYGTYNCWVTNGIGSPGIGSIELYKTAQPQPDKRGAINAAPAYMYQTPLLLPLSTILQLLKYLFSCR